MAVGRQQGPGSTGSARGSPARPFATAKKQAIGEVVEWASGGAFKYGDVARMTEADAPKLRAATELMASTLPGATH